MKTKLVMVALVLGLVLMGNSTAMSTSGIGFDSTNSGSYASVGAGSSTGNGWWSAYMAWWDSAWNQVMSMGSENGWGGGDSSSIAPNLDAMIDGGYASTV